MILSLLMVFGSLGIAFAVGAIVIYCKKYIKDKKRERAMKSESLRAITSFSRAQSAFTTPEAQVVANGGTNIPLDSYHREATKKNSYDSPPTSETSGVSSLYSGPVELNVDKLFSYYKRNNNHQAILMHSQPDSKTLRRLKTALKLKQLKGVDWTIFDVLPPTISVRSEPSNPTFVFEDWQESPRRLGRIAPLARVDSIVPQDSFMSVVNRSGQSMVSTPSPKSTIRLRTLNIEEKEQQSEVLQTPDLSEVDETISLPSIQTVELPWSEAEQTSNEVPKQSYAHLSLPLQHIGSKDEYEAERTINERYKTEIDRIRALFSES